MASEDETNLRRFMWSPGRRKEFYLNQLREVNSTRSLQSEAPILAARATSTSSDWHRHFEVSALPTQNVTIRQ
jgi:hypothetical protein